MAVPLLKLLLPDRPVPVRVWRGPFRGARLILNPPRSLRKIFGLYEHELNPWLEQALRQVTRVVDVGANDGYFAFGCAAAFRRLGKAGEIIGIEQQNSCVADLQQSIQLQDSSEVTFQFIEAYAGREQKLGWVTLDSLQCSLGDPKDRTNTLVKIDVEGAEMDVMEGGHSWLHPSNRFVIEVHEERYLSQLKALFAASDHRLIRVNQSPLPLLGREMRKETNWWLVSDLGGIN